MTLSAVRVFDMTRVLAGPSATQILGDLGADVIKIERPGTGDDSRGLGPPYLRDASGNETNESAYYLSANRNKRSVTLNLTSGEGQELARSLIAKCDVVIENFRTGNLAQYGLAYDQIKDKFPRLVYCSITGFGQTGPYAKRAGYDYLVQGMGGIMSVTGEPDGPPEKVGVGIADLMTGMYAVVAILAALRHRDATGAGQYIDMALLDTQVAWLSYVGQNYLTSGVVPRRVGNQHPNIMPYQVFGASDGLLILALGNDAQFERFCTFCRRGELAKDARFATNAQRLKNRETVTPIIADLIAAHPIKYWVKGLTSVNVPCSPINAIDQVFADPQVKARGMEIAMPHQAAGESGVRLIGSPIKMSETPVSYRRPPPALGEQTGEVLQELLGLDATAVEALRRRGVI
jgi:crotonobetainyl-CoA:carnitine CoA-transferase CaiB-like acyl-CoA transferase